MGVKKSQTGCEDNQIVPTISTPLLNCALVGFYFLNNFFVREKESQIKRPHKPINTEANMTLTQR